MSKKIAIIGAAGYVGSEMVHLFKDYETVRYDPALNSQSASQAEVNECDVAFVCVPTETKQGGFCDTSIVEDTMKWLNTPLIVIRSTVPPGTTQRLVGIYEKRIVFQPEYVGETVAHPLNDSTKRNFLVLGGDKELVDEVIDVYQMVYNANVNIQMMTSREAEVVKYMENSFIGAYVVFCNEFYQICQNYGVDWNKVREGFLADPRMTPYWTFVYKDKRGFDGKCLPKDLNAIVSECEASTGYRPEFMKAVLINNDRMKKYEES